MRDKYHFGSQFSRVPSTSPPFPHGCKGRLFREVFTASSLYDMNLTLLLIVTPWDEGIQVWLTSLIKWAIFRGPCILHAQLLKIRLKQQAYSYTLYTFHTWLIDPKAFLFDKFHSSRGKSYISCSVVHCAGPWLYSLCFLCAHGLCPLSWIVLFMHTCVSPIRGS